MCGVVGLIGTPEAAREAFLALTTLQHRGQDAAGILSYDHDGFHRVKNTGLVESVFNRENMASLTGDLAVGHVRYSTIGRGDLIDVQPFLINYPFGIGLVHNGNIVNCAELAKKLKAVRRHLLTRSDSEVIMNLFAEGLARSAAPRLAFADICRAVGEIYAAAKGSYSIVSMIAGHGLVAFRDPLGIRPLVLGRRKKEQGGYAYAVVSESVALSFLGYEVCGDLAPGEVVYIDHEGRVHRKVLEQRSACHCMFEWVYFASPESVIDERPVYGTRIGLGKNLAHTLKKLIAAKKILPDLVVPVPESARIAAIALSEEIGVPYREVLIKNRYIKRTFILDTQEKRQSAVNLKLSPVRSEIVGKKVLLVDDSIVRGTTSKKIIDLIRQAGASEVYFVSTCPPIRYPCYYGIDFPSSNELIASGKDFKAIDKTLGADRVIYQEEAGLKNAIGMPKDALCLACLTGEYPCDVSDGQQFSAKRKKDREGKK